MFEVDKLVLKHLERSPNRYAEVKAIANKAKQIADMYDGQMFHSEAITCAMTEHLPKYDYKQLDSKLDLLIKDMFCETEDSDVKFAVYDSLMLSRKKHYLIYVYNNIEEAGRQARVRVLTNLLWYKASE